PGFLRALRARCRGDAAHRHHRMRFLPGVNPRGSSQEHAENYPNEDAFSEAMSAWNAECWEFDERKTAGSVVAKEHGCGFATLLVITGPLNGTLWWDGRATCDLIVPLSLDHSGGARPVTFGEWLGRDSWDLLPPGWG
ncbi:hypothetical protein ACFT0D_33410, partial [Streptomyces sp. NPDC056982]